LHDRRRQLLGRRIRATRTQADHRAGDVTVCAQPGCGQPARARVCLPLLPDSVGPGLGFTIVRPADTPVTVGDLLCLDCTHAGIDDMLMRALPQPGATP
jgi:hypothetical protein